MAWQMESKMNGTKKGKGKSIFTSFDDTRPQSSEDIAKHYREMGIDI